MSQFDNWPVNDLRLLKHNEDDGPNHYIVFSVEMDAVTVIDKAEADKLRLKGVQEIDILPD